jgi:exonuclease VII small subunit
MHNTSTAVYPPATPTPAAQSALDSLDSHLERLNAKSGKLDEALHAVRDRLGDLSPLSPNLVESGANSPPKARTASLLDSVEANLDSALKIINRIV